MVVPRILVVFFAVLLLFASSSASQSHHHRTSSSSKLSSFLGSKRFQKKGLIGSEDKKRFFSSSSSSFNPSNSNMKDSVANHKLSKGVIIAASQPSTSAGNSISATPSPAKSQSLRLVLATWAVLQVASVLSQALKRLAPVAWQPFQQQDLTQWQWAAYAAWVIAMAYTEGYQAFHLKFSPLVVERAFLLSENPSIINCLLAGPYSMGLFAATRKRLIVSWFVTLFVFVLVSIVKRLPYPYRCIVDGGVVVGLSIGLTSMIGWYVRALLGRRPGVDACLVQTDSSKKL